MRKTIAKLEKEISILKMTLVSVNEKADQKMAEVKADNHAFAQTNGVLKMERDALLFELKNINVQHHKELFEIIRWLSYPKSTKFPFRADISQRTNTVKTNGQDY